MGAGHLRALGAVCAIAIVALACAGPRVTATDVRVLPSPLPGHQRVQAILVNRGGQGEAKVVVRLRDASSGRIISANHTVELQRRDRIEMIVDVPAPPGTYTAELTLTFPPT